MQIVKAGEEKAERRFSLSEIRAASTDASGMPGFFSDTTIADKTAAPEAKRFEAKFIEAGPVKYGEEMVLVEDETLDRMAKTMVGKPVVDWDHQDVPQKSGFIGKGKADGVVYSVWKGNDGWWHCGFVLWTDSAVQHAQSGAWYVSCAYVGTDERKESGTWHNIPYDTKILDGEYTHLALVRNPRYEAASIRANSRRIGGTSMFELLKRKKAPQVLRLNAGEAGSMMLEVDGAEVPLTDALESSASAEGHDEGDNLLKASDEDVIEVDGKKHKVGDLKNAIRRKNGEETEEEKKERERKEKERKAADEERKRKDKEREAAEEHEEEQERRIANAVLRELRHAATLAGKGAGAKVGGSSAEPENTDKALEAALALNKEMKERLDSLEKEVKVLRNRKSDELRNSVREARLNGTGASEEAKAFVARFAGDDFKTGTPIGFGQGTSDPNPEAGLLGHKPAKEVI